MKRPNIVVINPDQMRADALHHLGNEASFTPNMDALAEEGVSFSNAYCQNSVCVPSRCSFMTGLYPHVHGHRTMGYLLRDGEENIFKEMKDNGYFVWSDGRGDLLAGQDRKWLEKNIDVLYEPIGKESGEDEGRGEKGSDTYYSFYRGIVKAEKNHTVETTDVEWTKGAVEQIKNRPADKPFFLFLGLTDPHPPYRVEQKYVDHIETSNLPPRKRNIQASDQKPSMENGLFHTLGVKDWGEERFDQLRTLYLGMCAKVDEQVGWIVEALKEEGIYDDTAIFIFSDHGDYTGDYGLVEKSQNTFPDCLTNVPFIVKPPKGEVIDSGVNDNLVELVDFYATAMSYAKISPKRTHFGKNLQDTMADKTKEHRKYVFCEGGRNYGEKHCMEQSMPGVDEYDPRLNLQASEGGEHTKATMIRSNTYKYVRRLYEQDEFYDLKEGEQVNQIGNRKYKEEIVEMKEALLEWYQETCDVVPFDIDQRFSDDYMVNLMSSFGVPSDYLREQVSIKKRKFSEVMAEMMAMQKVGSHDPGKENNHSEIV